VHGRGLVLVFAFLPSLLSGQGVTTAAIQGSVLRENGSPIPGATIRLTNTSDGRRWEVATSVSGRYILEDVAIGGPYRIDVRALGYALGTRTGFVLALGQRLSVDFTLRLAAIELPPVTVDTTSDPVLNPSRTGPAEIISARRIAALPNPGRDFLTLTVLSPQVAPSPSSRFAPTGGISIAGQNRLLNSFQIDGGLNHDLYTGRMPGRETLPRPISLEALEEIQVTPVSFDVRHGTSAGGLVNAVTKSGTNAVRGSVFGVLANGALVGKDAAGEAVGDFTTSQYGGSVGGPIVRDRMHYFLSLDLQHRVVPDPGPLITGPASSADTLATRMQDILRTTYNLDPGTLRLDMRVPTYDVFGKITVQLRAGSHLEASHHYVHGARRGFLDRETPDLYNFSSAAQENAVTGNAARLIWTTLVGGRWSSELIVSYLDLRDRCRASANYPLIVLRPDRGPPALGAGTPLMCPSAFAQQALEVTENLTVGLGAHVVTLGTHGYLLHFADDLLQTSRGLWNFESLDSLVVGRAYHYERALPGPLRAGGVDFRARQVGWYVQDRWNPTPRLTVIAGLRVDVPVLPDAIPTSETLKNSLGIDTGVLPSGNLAWSPRLALNYDLQGVGRTFLRGGFGVLSGSPPYTWFGNAYRDDGTKELFLICDGAQVPRFVPLDQPATCANGTVPKPRFSFFTPEVRLPQNLKVALGLDHRFPGAFDATIDLLYTRAVHALYVSDANLLPPSGVAAGEDSRPLYGTVRGTIARRDSIFGQVIQVSNRNGDYGVSLSVQLRKQFGDRGEASVLYAHARAWDRMSLVNYPARANLEQTPLDGTLEDRRLRTSFFERPHRVLLTAAVRLPYRVSLSLLYAGASGTPFTYVVNGDANADGIGTGPMKNDIVYVPLDRADVALDGNGSAPGVGTAAQQDSVYALLDGYIRAEPCLRSQRGQLLERNSCRNPWFGVLSARLTKVLPTGGRHSLELTADVYNVLNLLNRGWGEYRVTTLDPRVPLLALFGYDATRGRGVYGAPLTPADRNAVQDFESRWQVVLGARYTF